MVVVTEPPKEGKADWQERKSSSVHACVCFVHVHLLGLQVRCSRPRTGRKPQKTEGGSTESRAASAWRVSHGKHSSLSEIIIPTTVICLVCYHLLRWTRAFPPLRLSSLDRVSMFRSAVRGLSRGPPATASTSASSTSVVSTGRTAGQKVCLALTNKQCRVPACQVRHVHTYGTNLRRSPVSPSAQHTARAWKASARAAAGASGLPGYSRGYADGTTRKFQQACVWSSKCAELSIRGKTTVC